MIAKKNGRVIKAIEEAKRTIAKRRGLKEFALGKPHIDEIVDDARKLVDDDIRTYFDDIVKTMRSMLEKNLNPFDHMGYVLDAAVERDYHAIENIFLVQSMKDCLGCEYDGHLKMQTAIQKVLIDENDFFGSERNQMDRMIAAETAVTVWAIIKQPADFITDDTDFHTNFNVMLVRMASVMKGNSSMINLMNV
ncbi:MAG: hypothetical protein WC375_00435 [Methanomassiliicoccales archaeon]